MKRIKNFSQLNEANSMYQKLVGKVVTVYNKQYEILGVGERNPLYRQFNQQIPHNPMGYSIEPGTYFAVKNLDNDRIQILNPSFGEKALDALKSETQEGVDNLVPADIAGLEMDQVVFYKTNNNTYIAGKVADDFGDGKFFEFPTKIQIDKDYSDTHFEVYPGDELEKRIYVKK